MEQKVNYLRYPIFNFRPVLLEKITKNFRIQYLEKCKYFKLTI